MQYVRNILLAPSEDVHALALGYARSREFRSRSRGLIGRLLRRYAEGSQSADSDLLSYVLYEGGFARLMAEMGRRDARAVGEKRWADFWEERPTSDAEAAHLEEVTDTLDLRSVPFA